MGLFDKKDYFQLAFAEEAKKNYKKAISYWEKAAKKGNLIALYNLSTYYEAGKGVEQDKNKAIELLLEAGKKGEENSQYVLAEYYLYGIDPVETDVKVGLEWLERAAHQGQEEAIELIKTVKPQIEDGTWARSLYEIALEELDKKAFKRAVNDLEQASNLGNAKAKCRLAVMLTGGKIVKQDFERAFQLCKEAADMGNEEAQYFLGTFYEGGVGTKENMKSAIKWYEEAARQGHVVAKCKMASIKDGSFVKNLLEEAEKYQMAQDYKKAARRFQKAAQMGDATAYYKLAMLFLRNYEFDANLYKVPNLLKKAAKNGNKDAKEMLVIYHFLEQTGVKVFEEIEKTKQGDSEAQFNVGFYYFEGILPENKKLAKKWFEKAATGGCVSAQYFMGVIYEEEEKNISEAIKWYREPAWKGNAEAQFHMGICLCQNEDIEDGKVWLEKAAKNGSENAKEALYMIFRE